MKYPPELRDQACRLYIPGVRGATKIGKMLGVPKSTVMTWISPGRAELQRQQSRDAKRRRTGVCEDCGGVTHYNGRSGVPVSTVCGTCSRIRQQENARWSREAVIAAIQLFHERNGRPPSAREWQRADRGADYLSVNAVARYGGWEHAAFATWSDAIRAAGFEPLRPNQARSGSPRSRTPQGRFAKEAA